MAGAVVTMPSQRMLWRCSPRRRRPFAHQDRSGADRHGAYSCRGDGENVIVVVPGANGEVSEADAEKAVSARRRAAISCCSWKSRLPFGRKGADTRQSQGRDDGHQHRSADGGCRAALGAGRYRHFQRNRIRTADRQDRLSADARIEAMQALANKTASTLIVTLGADGVVAKRNGKLHKAASLKITPVDTVGAGTRSAAISSPASTPASISTPRSPAPPRPALSPASSRRAACHSVGGRGGWLKARLTSRKFTVSP